MEWAKCIFVSIGIVMVVYYNNYVVVVIMKVLSLLRIATAQKSALKVCHSEACVVPNGPWWFSRDHSGALIFALTFF